MVNKDTSSSPIKKIYKVSCVLFGSAQYVPGLYEAFIMTIFAMLMFPWKWGLQHTWALSGALLNPHCQDKVGQRIHLSDALLATPENAITYHNALCLSPQNFA